MYSLTQLPKWEDLANMLRSEGMPEEQVASYRLKYFQTLISQTPEFQSASPDVQTKFLDDYFGAPKVELGKSMKRGLYQGLSAVPAMAEGGLNLLAKVLGEGAFAETRAGLQSKQDELQQKAGQYALPGRTLPQKVAEAFGMIPGEAVSFAPLAVAGASPIGAGILGLGLGATRAAADENLPMGEVLKQGAIEGGANVLFGGLGKATATMPLARRALARSGGGAALGAGQARAQGGSTQDQIVAALMTGLM